MPSGEAVTPICRGYRFFLLAMKQVIYILLSLVAGIALGRLTIRPKVVTETVVEYHSINTSAVAPSIVSEPIGTRKVKVMLRKNLFPNIDQVGDDKEDNFPNINQIGDSTEMVKKHFRGITKKVEGLSNGLSNQPVTDSNGFVTAELPIRDYTFTDDSTYTITARGVYVESLPQIEFTPRTVTTTRTETVVRTPRITHGLQMGGGVALTPDGFKPALYVGYGLTINF